MYDLQLILVPITEGGERITAQLTGKNFNGLLRMVRIEKSKHPAEQNNIRQRALNMWQDHINSKNSIVQRLPSSCIKSKLLEKRSILN